MQPNMQSISTNEILSLRNIDPKIAQKKGLILSIMVTIDRGKYSNEYIRHIV